MWQNFHPSEWIVFWTPGNVCLIVPLQERTGVQMIMIQDDPMPTGADKPLRITGDPHKVQVSLRRAQCVPLSFQFTLNFTHFMPPVFHSNIWKPFSSAFVVLPMQPSLWKCHFFIKILVCLSIFFYSKPVNLWWSSSETRTKETSGLAGQTLDPKWGEAVWM